MTGWPFVGLPIFRFGPWMSKERLPVGDTNWRVIVKSLGSGVGIWVGIQAVPLTSCIFLGKSFKQCFSELIYKSKTVTEQHLIHMAVVRTK